MAGSWLKSVNLDNVDDALAAQIFFEFDKDRNGYLDKKEVESFIVEWCNANQIPTSQHATVSKAFWSRATQNQEGLIYYADILTAAKAAISSPGPSIRLRIDDALQVPLGYATLPKDGTPSQSARHWVGLATTSVNSMFPKSVLSPSHCALLDASGRPLQDDTEVLGTELAKLSLGVKGSPRAELKADGPVSEAEQEQTFAKLFALPGNKVCADCNSPDPAWTSVNLGIFICMGCSGVHRSLGTHISQVFSSKLDRWNSSKLARMKSNNEHNAIYEYHVPAGAFKPKQHSKRQLREQYIRAKYEGKFLRGEGAKAVRLEPVYDPNEDSAGSEAQGVGMLDTAGILFLTLVEGKNLPKMDVIGSADPYVVFQFGQKQLKSKVVKNNVSPNFNKERFQICVDKLSSPLQLGVWDWDAGSKDDFIGSAVIDLAKTVGGSSTEADLWVDISDHGKPVGSIRVILQFTALDH